MARRAVASGAGIDRLGRSPAVQIQAQAPGEQDEEEEPEDLGPAARATLRMLEWERLCSHVAKFASTTAGREAAKALRIGSTVAESRKLLSETLAADVLEGEYAADLDFGGISTAEVGALFRFHVVITPWASLLMHAA